MRYDYDMLGNRIHQASMEAGERWMLNDVTGKPIRAWDSRGHTFRTTYDALRRPRRFVPARTAHGPELLVERTIYGETPARTRRPTTCAAKWFQLFDQAGVVTSDGLRLQGQPAAQPRAGLRSHTRRARLVWLPCRY